MTPNVERLSNSTLNKDILVVENDEQPEYKLNRLYQSVVI